MFDNSWEFQKDLGVASPLWVQTWPPVPSLAWSGHSIPCRPLAVKAGMAQLRQDCSELAPARSCPCPFSDPFLTLTVSPLLLTSSQASLHKNQGPVHWVYICLCFTRYSWDIGQLFYLLLVSSFLNDHDNSTCARFDYWSQFSPWHGLTVDAAYFPDSGPCDLLGQQDESVIE